MTAQPPVLDFQGRVVLVTGGAGGIGSGISRTFAQAGAAVMVHTTGRRPGAEALVEELRQAGFQAASATADIRDPKQCAALVKDAIEHFGRLDVLINNAGAQPLRPLAEMTAADWQQVVDTNLTGTFNMTQAAAGPMRAQGGGAIINIASVEGSLPAVAHAHYSASKAGIIMLTRSTALEYGRHGIRANAVSPGLIDCGGLAASWPAGYNSWINQAPLARTGTPADIAQACLFLASPLAGFVSGHNLVVDGAMSARPAW
ncbi:MAG: SDR family oxidoreductase [Bifidobacteriaceae bacterium]|jgi:NAD(P)-dependent dehydrogenase (short-subunit alcohol dehydrogenase family)|nr:SDR family oxidoreductase [Bifidobacteriaceae bacterium]